MKDPAPSTSARDLPTSTGVDYAGSHDVIQDYVAHEPRMRGDLTTIKLAIQMIECSGQLSLYQQI